MAAAFRHYVLAVPPATDPGAGDLYTPVINTALYGLIEFLVCWGDSAAEFRVTLEACSDKLATQTQVVGFVFQRVSGGELHQPSQALPAGGYQTAPGSAQLYTVLVDPSYMPSGWRHVRLHVVKLTPGNVSGAILVRCDDARYSQEVTPAVLN